jgi:hypothetical protein
MAERAHGWLLSASAVLLGVFGAAAIVAPGWAQPEFPWLVGPLLAQTIGGWALGTAAIAAHAARVRRIELTFPLLVYVKLFGFLQLVVVVLFLDRLRLGALAYPYLLGLAALVAAAAVAAPRVLANPLEFRGLRGFIPRWGRLLALVVGSFVLLLAIATLVAGPDVATARGEVFPEQMSLFSIRAFSAFLFSIGAAIGSVLLARSALPYLHLGWAGLYLIVPITVAALLNLDKFDFAGRPGGLVYLLAYVVVGVAIAVVLWYDRRRPDVFRSTT